MAAFKQLIWQHIDVWAVAGDGGLVAIEEAKHEVYHTWLTENGYTVDVLDCTRPVDKILRDFYRRFDFERRFHYAPDVSSRALYPLQDAFTFDIPEGGGHVLELVRLDVAWRQEPDWVMGLLSLIRGYSRQQLALGRRFFALLVLDENSEMVNSVIEEVRVPSFFPE